MKRWKSGFGATVGLALAMTVVASAHNGATGIVGERMMGMMMLGEQVKLLNPAFASGIEPPVEALTQAAGMIRMHAGPNLTKLFPEGSIEPPSEASPAIWERWGEFSGYAQQLAELADELQRAADGTKTMPPLVPAKAMLVEGNLSLAELPKAATRRTEWEALDYDTLMGLRADSPHAGHAMVADPLLTGSTEPTGRMPRTAGQVFADITAVCSACHASFRN
jgi:cytochrome c556